MCDLNVAERKILMLHEYCNYSNFGVFFSLYYIAAPNTFNDSLKIVIHIHSKRYLIPFKQKYSTLIQDSCQKG